MVLHSSYFQEAIFFILFFRFRLFFRHVLAFLLAFPIARILHFGQRLGLLLLPLNLSPHSRQTFFFCLEALFMELKKNPL
jgi:hypothetical protein